MCYDTSKKFVEQCPHDPNSFFGFDMMTDAVQNLGNSGPRRADYLSWLKSVLYLNTADPEYFCGCVEAIAGELPVPPTVWPDTGYNYPLAVQQWLLQNTTCDTTALRQIYTDTRRTQFQMWANDPSRYKLDTTLPTMEQLGLDTLLAKHFQFAEVRGTDNFASIVPSYGVTKNPTDGQTELRFTLGAEAYVRVQVCDILGRVVAGDDERGRILSLGEHRLPLDLSNDPAGTYYLRLSLGTGEARTIKIVKD